MYDKHTSSGSHMPLDIAIHWSWRNPLNLLLVVPLLLTGLALFLVLF